MKQEIATTQERVNSLLKRGIIFSLVWLAGIGSVIALSSGLQAKRLIRESNGPVNGMGRVWWCLIVGGLGIVIWLPVVIIGVVNNFAK